MKPYIGKTVHFLTLDKQHHAAKVVYVSENDRCNLVIWNEFGGEYFHEEAFFDPAAKDAGSWHFIEAEASAEAPAEVASTGQGAAGAGDGVRKPNQATSN
jgi:hypothetical protein